MEMEQKPWGNLTDIGPDYNLCNNLVVTCSYICFSGRSSIEFKLSLQITALYTNLGVFFFWQCNVICLTYVTIFWQDDNTTLSKKQQTV